VCFQHSSNVYACIGYIKVKIYVTQKILLRLSTCRMTSKWRARNYTLCPAALVPSTIWFLLLEESTIILLHFRVNHDFLTRLTASNFTLRSQNLHWESIYHIEKQIWADWWKVSCFMALQGFASGLAHARCCDAAGRLLAAAGCCCLDLRRYSPPPPLINYLCTPSTRKTHATCMFGDLLVAALHTWC